MQDGNDTQQDEVVERNTASEQPLAEGNQLPSVTVYTQEDLDTKIAERHSTLDKQIAEQNRLINLGGLAGRELENAKAKINELEEQNKELVGKQDIDVAKVMADYKAKKDEFEKHKKASDWEELGRIEEKQDMERMALFLYASKVSKEQNVPFDALVAAEPKTPEDVDRQAKVISMVTPKQTMTVDSALGSGGGDMSWDKVKDAYAHGKISTKAYMEARKSRFTN